MRSTAALMASCCLTSDQPKRHGWQQGRRTTERADAVMQDHHARHATGRLPLAITSGRARERTVVVAQIEDLEALKNLDAIVAVDGIDALFIGRIDLTVALGAQSPDEPNVLDAIDVIIATARKAGKPIGMFAPRDPDVAGWAAKGVSLFLQGSDHAFLRAGAKAARAASGL